MVMLIVTDIIFGIQLAAAGVGLVLYFSSFFGRGIEDGVTFLIPAFACAAVASTPRVIRDRRFFLDYWGLGPLGVRSNFPFEMFPARREQWLNPLSWCCMSILFLHFFMLVAGTANHATQNSGAELRQLSLIVACGSGLSALAWKYPPTQKPDEAVP